MSVSAGEKNEHPRKALLWVRNVLIVFGVFWFSEWLAFLFGWSAGIMHSGAYSDNFFSAIYFGAFMSWERTLAAIFAGMAVTLIVAGRRSQFWSFLLGVLYAVDYSTRSHWVVPPTAWDHLSMLVRRFLPAIACIVAAFVTARLQRSAKSATVQQSG